MDFNAQSPQACGASLEALGFRRSRNRSSYRRNGLSIAPQHGWLTVRAKAEKGADPLWGQSGKPGLWKTVAKKDRKGHRREFDLPLGVLAGPPIWTGDDQPPRSPLEACLEWVTATAGGGLPDGWECPPREQIESWIPHQGLTLRSGPFVRQGSLVYAPNRLALWFPIVNELSDEISEARRSWLREVLCDGQNRWRMVRVGFSGAARRPAVGAEVDLSGAPVPVLEDLFRAGLDALRWVVSWLIWSVGLLADARVSCRVWEAPRAGASPQKGGGSS